MIRYTALTVFSSVVFLLATPAFARAVIDITGQVRARPEMRDNADFSDADDDETAFIGSRVRLNIKGSVDEDSYAKITIQDTRRWGEANHVSTGTEKQALDIYEAYFNVGNIAGSGVSLKGGRQTLVYGDQRLLGHLGWKDNARTHDAFKIMLDKGALKVDLFYAKEYESGKPSAEDYDDDLMGAYAVVSPTKGITIDLYGINWKTAGSETVDDVTTAVAGKNIWTYGGRVAAKIGAIDFTAEVALQSGDWNATTTHEAMAYAVKAGFTIDAIKTRIGVEYDAGSGDDDPSDDTHKTFVFPFHTNHAHYGYMDYFSWGNMTDIRISLVSKAIPKVVIKIDYHMFTLAEASDDWLNVVGTKTLLAASGTSDDAGSEIDLTVVYKATKAFKVVGGYSIFTPGEAATERSGGSDDSTWGYVMTIFNF